MDGFWLKMILKVSDKQFQERFSFIVTCSNLTCGRKWIVSVVTEQLDAKMSMGRTCEETRQQFMYKFYWTYLW